MSFFKKHLETFALALILLLAAFLNFWGVWDEGYGNEFYAACVKSMLQSWHNFFFVSFDPGGFVTVDKPPVGLWVQALSAKLFGFSGWSLILPQALAGVLSVAVLDRLVRRGFGAAAGLTAALALAVSPVFVAVAKTNNLDSTLILALLLAARELWISCETGRLRHLLFAMLLLGVGFNIKTLQAYLVLPALLAAYLFAAKVRWAIKVRNLLVSLVLLFAVSLSWCLIVDLTPANQRPYVDNSGNNSELSLALGYNGVQRLTGSMFGGSGNGAGAQPGAEDGGGAGGLEDDRRDGDSDRAFGGDSGEFARADDGDRDGAQENGDSLPAPGGSGFGGADFGGGAGGFGGMNEGGQRGVLRMFNEQMAGQTSWLLPFSLFAMLVLALKLPRRAGEDEERRRKLLAALLLWGGWILTMAAFFSVAGFFHRYYLATLSPGIAALFGIGFSELWRSFREKGWKWVLLPASLAATAAVQGMMLSRYSQAYVRWTLLAVCVLAGAAAVGLTVLHLAKRGGKPAAALAAAGLAALLIAPGVWSCTPLLYGSQASLPYAGPELARGEGGVSSDRRGGVDYDSLIDFLTKNNTGQKFLVAVPSSQYAEEIILKTGEPVMSVGGFLGSDRILTAESLAEMVRDGEVRYYLLADGGMRGGSDEVAQWVRENGTEVDSVVWNGSSGGFGGATLYDLAPSGG